MDKIKQLLQEQGRQVDDKVIQNKLVAYGLDHSNVSDEDAKTIADELLPSAQTVATLAVNNGAATPANSKAKGTGRGRKSAKQVSLKDAIVKAAKDTETELTTMETVIRQQKGKFIDQRSDALVNEIRNTSTEIVEAVTERLMEETPDALTFQQIGTELGEGLFPLSA